jgi:hypothetical protein
MVGPVACIGGMRNAYKVLVGKSEGKRPCGRLRQRWEDCIEMDHEGTGCEIVDWIHLAYIRIQWWALLNLVMNLWVP